MEAQVKAHYNSNNLQVKISDALEKAGKNLNQLIPKDLVPIDQLHTGGPQATINLLGKADLKPGSKILDAGCGLGGSSRLLAKKFDHFVTGIDLANQFVDTAKFLTNSTGLSDQVSFRQGSILEMPFASNSFDAVLCQHILMNIEDKEKVFKEFFRILNTGGKLILHEVVKGETEEISLPVPWAGKKEISFLEPWDNMESLVTRAGFKKVFVTDSTQNAADWWAKVKLASQKKGAAPGILGPHLIFGENAAFFGQTMTFNFEENRIKVVEAVFEKAGIFEKKQI